MHHMALNQLRQAALAGQSVAGGPGAGSVPFFGPPLFDPSAMLGSVGRHGGFGPARFLHEEPKPQHSYIGLIAMAILSNPEKKMVLSDIYQWILDNYAYFRTRGPGWRNSIRHNLSLNDCFLKSGRSANGKGHYWAIHPANVDDFSRGDFRRRRAQRKVRRHMGLSIGEDEEDSDDSPCNSPALPPHFNPFQHLMAFMPPPQLAAGLLVAPSAPPPPPPVAHMGPPAPTPLKKRTQTPFDVESLLASPCSSSAAASQECNIPGPPIGVKMQLQNLQGLLALSRLSQQQQQQQQFLAAMRATKIETAVPQNMGPGSSPGQGQQSSSGSEKSPTPPGHSEQQWKETFAKIMARSYQAKAAPGPISGLKKEPAAE